MKKFVSIFLAACAMSAMSVTAFARQADAVNVMSDESLKLSSSSRVRATPIRSTWSRRMASWSH